MYIYSSVKGMYWYMYTVHVPKCLNLINKCNAPCTVCFSDGSVKILLALVVFLVYCVHSVYVTVIIVCVYC